MRNVNILKLKERRLIQLIRVYRISDKICFKRKRFKIIVISLLHIDFRSNLLLVGTFKLLKNTII